MSLMHGKEILHIINNYDNILLVGHTKADGDALGSCLAMAYFLTEIGKKCIIYNESPIPMSLKWIKVPVPFVNNLKKLHFKPQLLIVLDCGDLKRIGESLMAKFEKYPSINIDHHYATPHFASLYNWCDHKKSSTGEMVSDVIRAANIPLKGGIAENIYITLVTDTGNFSYSNTSAETLRLSAELVDSGLDIVTINERLKKQSTPEGLRLRGAIIRKFTLHCNNKVAIATASLEELAKYKATSEETEGLVESLRNLHCVDIAALIREDALENCKLSLRSSGKTDVCSIAKFFGGGGHINAAGAELSMPLAEAKSKVLQKIEHYMQTLL